MRNAAGDHNSYEYLPVELATAGLDAIHNRTLPEHPEVSRHFSGKLHGWTFERNWYYWIAVGPPLPLKYATPLHELIGDEVRVEGHCACPSPVEWCGESSRGVTLYHVDTQEGLNILASTIKKWYYDAWKEALRIHNNVGSSIMWFFVKVLYGKD